MDIMTVVGKCSLCGGVVVQDDVGDITCRACGAELVPASVPTIPMQSPAKRRGGRGNEE